MNQAIFVGRIVAEPSLETTESGATVSNITVAVPRPYKNEEGVYETDFIDCTLWNNIAQNTAEYCKKGDVIGVKGRVQTNISERDGEKKKFMNIVAEKITFLSSRSKEQQAQEHDDMEEDFEPEME